MAVMNSSHFKLTYRVKVLLPLFLAGINIFWTTDFSSPEKTFYSLLSAAEKMDLDSFLDCCDLESMTGEQVTLETKDRIITALKNDPHRKEFILKILNYLNASSFIVLENTTISPEMKTLIIKNVKTDERAQLLFRKRNMEWKLSSLKQVKF